MKKLLFAGTVASTLLLGACGTQEEPKKEESPKELTQTQKDLEKTKGELEAIKEQQKQINEQNNTQQQTEPSQGVLPSEDDYSVEVTRDDVFDIIEMFEGPIDTETFKYNEPEQKSDGSWGFAFYDRETGELAGSYIIDKDGVPYLYDEEGELIW